MATRQKIKNIVTESAGVDFIIIKPSSSASVYATAPELLEACRSALASCNFDNLPRTKRELVNAIRKAKGE
jgi:hypothetical protein